MSEAIPQPFFKSAYLGPEGTFSYFAALEFLSLSLPGKYNSELQACPNFTAIFQAVAEGVCDVGFVPLENSLQGTVGQNFDLFREYADITMVGEMYAPITHSVLGNGISDINAIKLLYSHPQPLGQCRSWLAKHLPEIPTVTVDSTAAAAGRAAAEPAAAALGHERLAEMYNLNILAQAVEDSHNNWTRFVLIAREPREVSMLLTLAYGPQRTSLIFTLEDKPGTLANVLQCLADADVNLAKLESRPLSEPWQYAFFADVECALDDPQYADTLEQMQTNCASLRILGRYSQGPYLSRL